MEDNYSKWRRARASRTSPSTGAGRPSRQTPSRVATLVARLTARRNPSERAIRMKVAVISDIHANRHAFEAVLDRSSESQAAELWCLGDLVGYGAEPDACVELAREHVAVCLAGNHDLAVTGELELDEFSTGARIAAEWTRERDLPRNTQLPGEARPERQRAWRRALPRLAARSGLGVRASRPCRRSSAWTCRASASA